MGLASLFWFQLLLSPIFLSPLYVRVDPNRSPWLALLGFLLAPLAYTAGFAWRACRRSGANRGLATGAVFGMLFGALGFLPHAIAGAWSMYAAFDPTAANRSVLVLVVQTFYFTLVVGFFVGFYAVIGLCGGLLGQTMAPAENRGSGG
jgi:hypothetical protein